jgi:hypothetical protein
METMAVQFYYEDRQETVIRRIRGDLKQKGEAEKWERNFRQQQQKGLDM